MMSDHRNIHIQWSCGPPKYPTLSRIVTCPEEKKNRLHSRVIIPETPYPLSPFSWNKTCVRNHEVHELLTLRSSPVMPLWFYKINDVATHRKGRNVL